MLGRRHLPHGGDEQCLGRQAQLGAARALAARDDQMGDDGHTGRRSQSMDPVGDGLAVDDEAQAAVDDALVESHVVERIGRTTAANVAQ